MPRMRESALRKLITVGETSTVELKVASPRPDEMAERLCGLANAQGGFIIVGVADESLEIVGVPEKKIGALDLDKREVRAMQYVQDHGSITNREYRQLTGVSASTANRDLESLVGQKILIRIGGKRGTRYKLP